MTLSDIASVSTAFSGVAVTASVIYLAIQTRQAAKHASGRSEPASRPLLADLERTWANPARLPGAMECEPISSHLRPATGWPRSVAGRARVCADRRCSRARR